MIDLIVGNVSNGRVCATRARAKISPKLLGALRILQCHTCAVVDCRTIGQPQMQNNAKPWELWNIVCIYIWSQHINLLLLAGSQSKCFMAEFPHQWSIFDSLTLCLCISICLSPSNTNDKMLKKPTSKCYNHNLAEDIKQISQQFHLTDLISPIPFLRSHLARARVTLETFSRSTTCNLSPETDVRKSLAGQKWKKTMCPKWETGTVPKSRGDIVGCSCLI